MICLTRYQWISRVFREEPDAWISRVTRFLLILQRGGKSTSSCSCTRALLRARALLHCEIHHGRRFLCAGKMLFYMFSLLIFEQLVETIRGMASNRVDSP